MNYRYNNCVICLKGAKTGMQLEQNITQEQTLSAQAIQGLEVLQMNTQELLDYVRKTVMENPVLEAELPSVPPEIVPGREKGRMEWLESNDRQNRWYNRQDAERDERDSAAGDRAESLKDYVRSQLPRQSEALERAADYLVECLDENGWIPEPLEELSAESGIPVVLLERALVQIQNAEPWGVGARNLQECLLIQLFHRPDADNLTAKIVRDCLPELAKNHYNSIAKALQVSQDKVRRAVEQIRSLNPRPGNGFAHAEPTGYIIPDMVAEWNGNGFDIRLSRTGLPQLNISSYYVELQKESTDPEVTTYLDEKVRQAKWVISAVSQRQETMLRCMDAIMALQPEYFRHDRGALCPMALADVAERLGVHESTVSRAIRGKYIQCPDGVVPLSFFFSQAAFRSGTEGDTVSAVEAKNRLRALLLGEDARKPWSDQKLAELMGEGGCSISRRTVAKYRSELGFPPATGRKRV